MVCDVEVCGGEVLRVSSGTVPIVTQVYMWLTSTCTAVPLVSELPSRVLPCGKLHIRVYR